MSLSKKAEARAYSRQNRREFTDVLKHHGVTGKGYMKCTDGPYSLLLGMRAYQLRKRRGLPAKANLRDHLDSVELSAVMLVEAMAAKRIEEAMVIGTHACIEVTVRTAQQVAK